MMIGLARFLGPVESVDVSAPAPFSSRGLESSSRELLRFCPDVVPAAVELDASSCIGTSADGSLALLIHVCETFFASSTRSAGTSFDTMSFRIAFTRGSSRSNSLPEIGNTASSWKNSGASG